MELLFNYVLYWIATPELYHYTYIFLAVESDSIIYCKIIPFMRVTCTKRTFRTYTNFAI